MLFYVVNSGETIGEEWIDLEDENQIGELMESYFGCRDFAIVKEGDEIVINLDYENFMINQDYS